MESNMSTVPIELKQLEDYLERANRLLTKVKWTPKKEHRRDVPDASEDPSWRESILNDAQMQEVSLLKAARKISRDPLLLSEEVNHVLTVVRNGLQMSMHLSKQYTKFSGLDQLAAHNSRGALTDSQKAEFRAKYYTASAITLYVAAYYVSWSLSSYKSEEVSSVHLEFPGIPELSLQNPVRALECMVYYYAASIELSKSVQNDLDLIKHTLLFFNAAVDEIQLRLDSLQYTEPFTSQNYKLEQSDFVINGFESDFDSARVRIEFNRVELEEIVGNRDAKHELRRLAGRLLCYDPATKCNPMFDLGGLPPITMGYGEPGTGKSMLIAAMATLLDEYCARLGVPFLFWPMPDNVVSTFQGGSAERMLNWMKALKDPSKIVYAPIDDAENNLEERTRQGVSAGVREVIAVFLRNTEGAYAVHRGNTLIQLFTNLPEQIDKAVLSRINKRLYIGGAQTREDFLDQDYLWLKRHHQIDPSFVNMKDPQDYSYLDAQALVGSFAEIDGACSKPRQHEITDIVERTAKEHASDEHEFFAELFKETKNRFPYFTSRDVRNIQRAVDQRVMDFDFPEQWFDNPEKFFQRDYASKKEMIVELMRSNMRGLSLAEIRLEESVRYLDAMVEIAETGRRRRVEELVEDLQLRHEAQLRAFSGHSPDDD